VDCPVDRRTLEDVCYEGSVRVDRCPRCHGMWLDEGELEAIEHTIYHTTLLEASSIETEELAVAFAKHKADAPLSCPRCQKGMTRREYGYSSLVLIDTCPACMGIWLDGGEIDLIERFFERLHPDLAHHEAQRVAKHHLMAGVLRLLT
jgi:Zn-finger nucleic acid-binding protein